LAEHTTALKTIIQSGPHTKFRLIASSEFNTKQGATARFVFRALDHIRMS